MTLSTRPLETTAADLPPIGTPKFLALFKPELLAYCEALQYNIHLTDAEIEYLSWHAELKNSYQSPEAGKNSTRKHKYISFEIDRRLAGAYCFELLLSKNLGESDHANFVKAQSSKNRLSYGRFIALSSELKRESSDHLAVIRASLFLVISPYLKNLCITNTDTEISSALAQRGLRETFDTVDSEEFLTQFAVFATIKPELIPITRNLTATQNALLFIAFWPELHLRWIYSTEGGKNMIRPLVQGIESKSIRPENFGVWKWRWRFDNMRFQGGFGAKFYDAETDQLCEDSILRLENFFVKKDYEFFFAYLKSNADAAQLESLALDVTLSQNEILFLGHLVAFTAYFHRVNIFESENAKALLEGYFAYKKAFPQNADLANQYVSACDDDNAKTPTYVPGVLDTASGLFKYYLDIQTQSQKQDLFKDNKIDYLTLFSDQVENIPQAIRHTIQFMCQFSHAIFEATLKKRISCKEVATINNLKLTIKAWLDDPLSVRFYLNDAMEMKTNLGAPTNKRTDAIDRQSVESMIAIRAREREVKQEVTQSAATSCAPSYKPQF